MPISLTERIWICFMRVLADIISVDYVGLRHYSTGFAVSDLLPALRVRVPRSGEQTISPDWENPI